MAIIVNTQKKIEKVEETKETKEIKKEEIEETPKTSLENKLQLGPRKIITIHPWKAKAKKEFIKVFKKKGKKVSERDILDVLVYPYVDEEFFLTSAEVQYVLTELRKISIKDQNIEFILTCNECGEEFDVSTTIDDLVHYKETLIPMKDEEIEWKEINSLEELENNLKDFSEEPPTIINMSMNIHSYKNNKVNSVEEFLELYDELEMSEVEEMESKWKKVSSKFEIYQELSCPHCKSKIVYSFDVIPSFFDPLLPKE